MMSQLRADKSALVHLGTCQEGTYSLSSARSSKFSLCLFHFYFGPVKKLARFVQASVTKTQIRRIHNLAEGGSVPLRAASHTVSFVLKCNNTFIGPPTQG
jgi:hypothetical protein